MMIIYLKYCFHVMRYYNVVITLWYYDYIVFMISDKMQGVWTGMHR